MDFKDTVEILNQEAGSIQSLFGDVTPLKRYGPQQLAQAAGFINECRTGKRPLHHLREAMTTSDFPGLFGDILDRQLLGNYQAIPATWRNYTRRGTVPDFRDAKRYAIDGAESPLSEVDENGEYPAVKLSESSDTVSVAKFGRRLPYSWETMVNDDLNGLDNSPAKLARAARRSEERFVTGLFVGANGPDATLYGHGNQLTGNPVLSIEALQAAMQHFSELEDEDGEPIAITGMELVVPPALEITAQNILNGLQIRVGNQGGTANQTIVAQNWMSNRLRLNVNHYIPKIATTANGNTSWFIFANQDSGRPALEMDFLRGFEEPQLFQSAPTAQVIGGGMEPFSFQNDTIQYKVRHVFGGTAFNNTGGWRSTVASNGSGG